MAVCRPVLAITGGDPCGIGPEVILKAVAASSNRAARLVVIGDWRVFTSTARRLRMRQPSWPVIEALQARPTSRVTFLDLRRGPSFHPRHSSARAGAASLHYVRMAVELWKRGLVDGLVTAPVTKWAIQRTHRTFIGHTEWLAKACGAPCPVMMFVSPSLRVVLLTRHLALRRVPRQVTQALLEATLKTVISGLRRWFGIARPHLAICGLNPHAGEAGHFGDEEQRLLKPAVRRLARSVRLDGPFAADGFFTRLCGSNQRSAIRYDAVVCWYHDQGLIPFKMVARDRGCQVSLGLPCVRTSPDHGSALDIAGRGVANPGSMRYAIEVAAKMLGARR